MKLRKTAALVITWTVTMMLAAPALADSPTQSAYGCHGCEPLTPPSGSTLPFTGLNLGLLALFGVLLLGAGFAVRRSTRSRADS